MSRSTTHAAPRSSKKATKAIVATALGVALLAAGGGTFANWSDTQDYDATSISSGRLELANEGGVWTNSRGTVIDPAAYAVVPGEVLTFSDTVTITAEGDILAATLTTNFDRIVTPPAETATPADIELANALTVGHTLTVGETVVDEANPFPVTAANNGAELDVQVQVTFPQEVTGLTAQNATATLDGLAVVITQNNVA